MKYPVKFNIELLKNPYKGFYIALEGIDGSGKTTQAEKLKEYFEKNGRKVFLTHEPRRDGVMGSLVNDILKSKKKIPDVAIQYLFAAQRAIHLQEMVIPSLKKGEVVISDRSFWSSIPYGLFDRFDSSQAAANRLLAALSILSMYHQFIAPDLSFFLDVNVNTSTKRLRTLKRKAELYEKAEKLERIKNGYDFLLSNFSKDLIRINAERHIDEVTDEIVLLLEKKKV